MPNKLTESAIEDFAIKLFERLGYSYVYAPDIAHDGENLSCILRNGEASGAA